MHRLRLRPDTYRRVTVVALVALGFIVVTGGTVRLTGSGLGCPDWPTCAEDRIVAPWDYHAMVEFVNRTVTGLVSVAVVAAVLGSLVRVPRRRDLTLLSLGLVAGVIAQIVLGGLTVLFELKPQFVMAHFLLSMVLVTNAVVLVARAGQPDAPRRPVTSSTVRRMAQLSAALAAVAVVWGTVVTGSGPHGGDPDVERLGFFVPDVARLHSLSVLAFLAATLVTLARLRAEGAPPALLRRAELLLAVAAAQAVVGWAQYFTGVPELLVGIHIAGATATWAAVVWWLTGFHHRPASAEVRAEPVRV